MDAESILQSPLADWIKHEALRICDTQAGVDYACSQKNRLSCQLTHKEFHQTLEVITSNIILTIQILLLFTDIDFIIR